MGVFDRVDGEENVLIAVLIVIGVLIIALWPSVNIAYSFDREPVEKGDSVVLRVLVRVPSYSEHVAINAVPFSEHLEVVGEPVIARKVPAGGSVEGSFLILVDDNAYTGDHLIKVFVSVDGKTYVRSVSLKVV